MSEVGIGTTAARPPADQSPFEFVYSALLLAALVVGLVAVLRGIVLGITDDLETLQFASAFVIFLIFLCFQILRIYDHLKSFDIAILAGHEHHFICSLKGPYNLRDRFLRLSLALLLILGIKELSEFVIIPEFALVLSEWVGVMVDQIGFKHSPALLSTEAAAISLRYSGTLMWAFVVLIFWDLNVYGHLVVLRKDCPAEFERVKVFSLAFFYIRSNDDEAFSSERNYFCTLKFCERFMGFAFCVCILICSALSNAWPALMLAVVTGVAFLALFLLNGVQNTSNNLILAPFRDLFSFVGGAISLLNWLIWRPTWWLLLGFVRAVGGRG